MVACLGHRGKVKPLRSPMLRPQSPHPTLDCPLFLTRDCGSLQITPYWVCFAEPGNSSELCRCYSLKNEKANIVILYNIL